MWLLLGKRSPNLSVSVLEVKRSLCRVTALWLAPDMKTPWVGNMNVAELIVLCLPWNLKLSTNQMKLLSWVCGTLAGKFFLRLFFQGYSRWHWRGRWPSEFLCSLSIFFFVVLVFFTFPLQAHNYKGQTKFQYHAQYPDNSAGSCSGYPAVSTLLGVLRRILNSCIHWRRFFSVSLNFRFLYRLFSVWGSYKLQLAQSAPGDTRERLLDCGGSLQWNVGSVQGKNQAFWSLFSEKLQFSLRFISITVAKIIKRKDLISKCTLLLSCSY